MYPALICPIFSFIFLHLIASNNHTTSIVMWAHRAHTRPAQLSLVLPFFLSGMKYVLVEAEQIHPLDVAVCGLTHTQGSAFIFGRSVKIPPSLACFLSSLFGTGWLFEVFVNISFLLCCVIIKHVAGHKKVIIVQFRLLTRPDTEKSD